MLRGATSSSLSSKRLFVSSKKKENTQTLSRRKRSAFTTTSASSNMGKDFVESFFDVADFLSGASSFGTSELAENIGRDCYVDVNGWHLFLKDMKPQGSFHQGLANVVIGTIVKNGKKCSEERHDGDFENGESATGWREDGGEFVRFDAEEVRGRLRGYREEIRG